MTTANREVVRCAGLPQATNVGVSRRTRTDPRRPGQEEVVVNQLNQFDPSTRAAVEYRAERVRRSFGRERRRLLPFLERREDQSHVR